MHIRRGLGSLVCGLLLVSASRSIGIGHVREKSPTTGFLVKNACVFLILIYFTLLIIDIETCNIS